MSLHSETGIKPKAQLCNGDDISEYEYRTGLSIRRLHVVLDTQFDQR